MFKCLNVKIKERGVALYLALMIMFILIAIGLGVSLIIVSQMKMMKGMGDSVVAFYAADTGIDKTIFYDNKVIPFGGTRGLCYMRNPIICPDCDWTCSGCGWSGADCNDTTCTDCTLIYESTFNGKEYRVEAKVTGVVTTIKSTGSYKGIKRAIETSRIPPPVAAMKTQNNGYFYVPAIGPHTLKMVFLFDDGTETGMDLTGDQTGGTGEYPHAPNGIVGDEDLHSTPPLGLINAHFGQSEGDPSWEYMADVVADGIIDISDLSTVSLNKNHIGTYITDLTGVTILFNTGEELSLGPQNMVKIPSGAASFTVKKNGVPIGAYILFYP